MTATTVICSRIKRQVLSAKKILTSVSAHSDNNYRRLPVNTEAANIRMGKKITLNAELLEIGRNH